MPTDTFPIASDADDGSGSLDQSTWPPTGGIFTNEDGTQMYAAAGAYISGGTVYYISTSLMRWDTSSIPASATISAANLLLYAIATTDDSASFSVAGEYYDFGGEPTVAADISVISGTSIFTPFRINTVSIGAVRTIPLTDLTGIMRSGETNPQGNTGITGIRVSTNNPGAPTPIVDNNVTFAALEHATLQEPRLEVTYTVPSSGVPIAWIRA